MYKIWIALLFVGFLLGLGSGVFLVQQRKIPFTPAPTLAPTGHQDETNIRVSKPKAHERISLPFTIEGEARVFENQLAYRIVQCEGRILAEGIATALGPDIGQFGRFTIPIDTLAEPNGEHGCIEVFSYSPKDGSEINVVTMPVVYDLSNTTKLNVYFGQEGEMNECTKVFPLVRYSAKTQTPARVALEALLKGPAPFEKADGYFTSINQGVKIQKLTIVDGVARVDFDKTLEEAIGGSCRVTNIRAQITQTLMQFPSVKSVVISIDGRTEDILQP